MSRLPTTQDLIDYLQQSPNVVVVIDEDEIQSPGDYISLRSALAQIQSQIEQEEGEGASAISPQAPRG